VPFLLPIQQIDNEWYYIKNHKLKNVNLGWNGINQRCLNVIKHFI
jgi:outer membrane protein assembly factor BamE (lipoprotein component of BamABCDE complex)